MFNEESRRAAANRTESSSDGEIFRLEILKVFFFFTVLAITFSDCLEIQF